MYKLLVEARNTIQKAFYKFTSIDSTSMMLFRVAFACTGIIDICFYRLTSLSFFLTDSGAIPRKFTLETSVFSLFHASGSYTWSLFLLLSMLVLCLFILVGLHTKKSLVLYYVLLLSLHWRNEVILGGPDRLHLLLSMWAIFLPLQNYGSIDAKIKFKTFFPGDKLYKDSVTLNHRIAIFSVIFLIFTLYLVSSVYKLQSNQWYGELSSIHYVLNTGNHTTSLGQFFADKLPLTRAMTLATLIIEWSIPALLIIPFNLGLFRAIAACLIIVLKTPFWLFLYVSLFPPLGITLALFLMPSRAWKYVPHEKLSTAFSAILSFVYENLPRSEKNSFLGTQNRYTKYLITLLLTYNLILHVICNVDDLFKWELPNTKPMEYVKHQVKLFRLDQSWIMFRNAPRWKGWPEAVLSLENGEKVDVLRPLWDKNPGDSLKEPAIVAQVFSNSLSHFIFHNKLSTPAKSGTLYFFYGFYECNAWNKREKNKAIRLDYYFNYSRYVETDTLVKKGRKHVWSYDCPPYVEAPIYYKYMY